MSLEDDNISSKMPEQEFCGPHYEPSDLTNKILKTMTKIAASSSLPAIEIMDKSKELSPQSGDALPSPSRQRENGDSSPVPEHPRPQASADMSPVPAGPRPHASGGGVPTPGRRHESQKNDGTSLDAKPADSAAHPLDSKSREKLIQDLIEKLAAPNAMLDKTAPIQRQMYLDQYKYAKEFFMKNCLKLR